MFIMNRWNRFFSHRYKIYHLDKFFTVFCTLFLISILVCLIGCHHQKIPDAARTKTGIPSWVLHRRDVRYPQAFYLIGIGMSEKDSASADENARIDLVKQIEMELIGEETSFQREESEKNKGSYTVTQESRVESNIKTRVDITIAGLTISERWYNEGKKRYYSLATLDRDGASEKLRSEIITLLDNIGILFLSGLEYERKRELVKALRNYQRAYGKRDILDKLVQKYRVIRRMGPEAGNPELDSRIENRIKSLSEIKKRSDTLISGIKIISLDGDNQKAIPGRPIPKELAVQVIFEESGREDHYPIAGLPIKFVFDSSTGQLDAEVITDAEGIAGSRVYKVDESENKANTISALIDLEEFPELRENKVIFTYYLPLPFSQDLKTYSWQEGTIKLVEEIISKIYDEGIIRIAILDFIDARSEKRLVLSRIIESDLRMVMAQAEDVIVVDTGAPEESSQQLGERAKALEADYYLSGVYWLYDKGLKINAKLVDTDKGTLAATGRVIIAEEAIHRADLQSIALEEQKEGKEGYSPDFGTLYDSGVMHNPELSYDFIIDTLYYKEEKEHPFIIDIWTDKKEYTIGDTLTIYVRSDKDCYLSLLDIGTSGKLTLLFPNSLYKDNFIQGGKTYSIPGDFWGFSLKVLAPLGIERIKAIATLKPFSLVKSKIYQGFYSLEKENVRGLRDIKVNMKTLSSMTWVQDYVEIRIVEKGKDQAKKTRGLRKEKSNEPQTPIDIIGTPGLKKDQTGEEITCE